MADSIKTGSEEIIKVMRQTLRNQLIEISNIQIMYAKLKRENVFTENFLGNDFIY